MTGCFSFEPPPTVIEQGFTKELKDMLYKKYELTIPPTAEFIEGYYDNWLQDPSVHISFKIYEEDFYCLTGEHWEKSDNDRRSYDDLFEDNITLENQLTYQNEIYTTLFYSEPDGEIITCAFFGKYSGDVIK